MSFRKYEEYKESGVEWLGKVPKHWEIRRLGVYGNFIAGSGFPHNEQGQKSGDYPFYKVSDTNLEGNSVYLLKAANYVTKEVAKKLRAKIAPAGGIMFPKVGAALLGNKRRVLTRESITDNNTIVFIPYSGVSKYWYYWLSELDFGQIANPGPVPSINEAQLREFPSICPPEEEQKQIAAFLDRETTKTDTLIDKQEQLITLLREKRQAIISHAVTRGLNPNVKMKDSGIEWLGEIPEHWQPLRLKWVVHSVLTGGTPEKEAFAEGYIDWFTPGDFKDEIVLKNAEKQIAPEKATKGLQFFPPNSVLIIGIGATLGKVGLIKTRSAANQQINGVIPNNRVNPTYLTFSLSAQNTFMKQTANISTLSIMNQDKTKQIPLAVPPIDEQKKIVAYLDKETTKIDTLIKKCETAIELLKERRTTLISAAVTGKIDVRSAI